MRKWLIKIWTEDLLPLYQHSKYLSWFLAFTVAIVGGIWTVVLLVYFRLQKWLNIYLEYFIKEDASGSKRFLSLKLDCLWRLLNKAEFRYICFEKTNVWFYCNVYHHVTVSAVFLVKLQWQWKEYFNLDVFRGLCAAALIKRCTSNFYLEHASLKENSTKTKIDKRWHLRIMYEISALCY